MAIAAASGDDIMVRIRSTDGRDYAMAVRENMSVGELKARVRASTDIEEGRQRLIYRGRVLQDDANSLASYHIEHNHTIHLVARPVNVQPRSEDRGASASSAAAEDMSPPGTAAPATATVGTPGRRLMVGAIAQTLLEDALNTGVNVTGGNSVRQHTILGPRIAEPPQPAAGSAVGRLGGRSILNLLPTMQGMGLRPAGAVGASNPSNRPDDNSLEHIRQAILTMRSIVSTMDVGSQVRTWEDEQSSTRIGGEAYSIENDEKSNDEEVPMAEEKGDGGAADDVKISSGRRHAANDQGGLHEWESASRTFFVGQWLDVKDTVNQWLEATVMDVRANSLFIHYNGWPTRWDEWIDADSSRLAPFRTRTIHSTTAPHNSPTPNNRVTNAPTTGGEDLRAVIPEVYNVFMRCAPALGALSRICEEDLEDEALNGALPSNANLSIDENGSASSSANNRSRPRVAPGMPWEAEQAREVRVANRRRKRRKSTQTSAWEDDSNFEATEDGEKWADTDSKEDTVTPCVSEERIAEARRRRRHINVIARQLGPLLDRLGRAVADLAPHVSNMVDETDDLESRSPQGADEVARAAGENPSSAEALPTPDQEVMRSPRPRNSLDLLHSATSRRRNQSAEAQRLQTFANRRQDNHTERSFERLISTPARSGPLGLFGGAGNVDIHIHAIVPWRNHEGNQADAPSPAAGVPTQRDLDGPSETAVLLPELPAARPNRFIMAMQDVRETAPTPIANTQPSFSSNVSPLHNHEVAAQNAEDEMEEVADDNQDTGLEIPTSLSAARRSDRSDVAESGVSSPSDRRSSTGSRSSRSARSSPRGRAETENSRAGLMGRISSIFRRPNSSSNR